MTGRLDREEAKVLHSRSWSAASCSEGKTPENFPLSLRLTMSLTETSNPPPGSAAPPLTTSLYVPLPS